MNGLHRQLERDHLGATFPFLQVSYDPVSDEADLRYLSSRRGFGRFVVGYSPDFEMESRRVSLSLAIRPLFCCRTFTLTPARPFKTSSLSERVMVDHFSTSLA